MILSYTSVRIEDVIPHSRDRISQTDLISDPGIVLVQYPLRWMQLHHHVRSFYLDDHHTCQCITIKLLCSVGIITSYQGIIPSVDFLYMHRLCLYPQPYLVG